MKQPLLTLASMTTTCICLSVYSPLSTCRAESSSYFNAGNYLQDDSPGAASTLVFSSIIKTDP